MEQIICPWESANWLLFSSNVPLLLPYSHFVAFVSSALSIIFLFRSQKQSFTKVFLLIASLFSLWVLIDWHMWATNKSNVVMFLWATQILIEIFIYTSALYLTYVFINKSRPKPIYEILGLSSLLPVIILLSTKYILTGIDISYCNAIEHPFIIFYSYGFEVIIIFLIIHSITKGYTNLEKGEKILRSLFGLGIITFLLSFTSGNIIGSITENWEYAQYGLFGMPIFIGLLSYLIIKYRTFNTKIIGAQALVVALIILIGSTLLVDDPFLSKVIISITLIMIIGLGYTLSHSVQKEVEQREKIEKLAKDLEKANDKLKELDQLKSEFLSLATHQIRSPLTAIRGYSSMILQGDFGQVPIQTKDAVEIIMKSTVNLINIVGEFLDISRIEQGRMVYNNEKFDIRDLVKEVVSELKPNVDKAKLSIEEHLPDGDNWSVNADKGKIRQIIGNLIDNAIKYTLRGDIKVIVDESNGKARVSIKDSGIGIPQDEMGKLFAKFSRTKDAHKTNVTGTGLGLYIAKKMLDAQGGDITVSSEGAGKGSTFAIELPRVS